MLCHFDLVDLDPKGHVGHNKKPNQGFPESRYINQQRLGFRYGCLVTNAL